MSAQTATPTDAAPMDHRHVLRALSGLLIVLFVAMISSTVVSVALPMIIGSRDGTQPQYTWVVTRISDGLAELGIDPAASSSSGSTLNVAAMPPRTQEVVRAAYGDATGRIFLISAANAVVGVIASLFLAPTKLRDSVDL